MRGGKRRSLEGRAAVSDAIVFSSEEKGNLTAKRQKTFQAQKIKNKIKESR